MKNVTPFKVIIILASVMIAGFACLTIKVQKLADHLDRTESAVARTVQQSQVVGLTEHQITLAATVGRLAQQLNDIHSVAVDLSNNQVAQGAEILTLLRKWEETRGQVADIIKRQIADFKTATDAETAKVLDTSGVVDEQTLAAKKAEIAAQILKYQQQIEQIKNDTGSGQ